MKGLFFKLFILIFLAASLVGFGQTYEATIEQSISGNILNVDLKLRTTSGTSDILGDATFIINYDSADLTYAGKDALFDGRWDNDNDVSYSDLIPSNTPSLASLSTIKSGSGSGLDIPITLTRVGRLTFTITNSNANSGVEWFEQFTSINDFSGSDIKSKFTFTDPDNLVLISINIPNVKIPQKFQLHPNYPNPFNPTTTLRFDIPLTGSGLVNAKLVIYNSLGQLIRNLYQDKLSPGRYEVQWDGTTDLGNSAPNGIYFAIFKADGYSQSRKLVLLK